MVFYFNDARRSIDRDVSAGRAMEQGRKVFLTEYERRALRFVGASDGQLRLDLLANDFQDYCFKKGQGIIGKESSVNAVEGLTDKGLIVHNSKGFATLTERGMYASVNNTTAEDDRFR